METSNAGNNNTQPQAAKRIGPVEGKELEIRRLFGDKEHNSDVNEDARELPVTVTPPG